MPKQNPFLNLDVSTMSEDEIRKILLSIDPDELGEPLIEIPEDYEAPADFMPDRIAGATVNGVQIQTKLTRVNYKPLNNISLKIWIVIHYVGAVSSARNNASYFYNNYVGASAHYFVDAIEIWNIVKDADTSWHCGGGLQSKYGHKYHGICTNTNSIGIEMCVKKDANGRWYYEKGTIENTVALVKYLQEKYNKFPAEKVIRHFDVTGKFCPAIYCDDDALFNDTFRGLPEQTETEFYALADVISNTNLNFREAPTTSADKLGSFEPGTEVETIAKVSNGWYKIDYNNVIGYVHGDYLKIKEEFTLGKIQQLEKELTDIKKQVDAHLKEFDWTTACPDWAIPVVQEFINTGSLKGDDKGELNLTPDMLRILVIFSRFLTEKGLI